MRLSKKWRLCLFVIAVTWLVPSLSAVIVEFREYHGKQIQCMHSGLGLAFPGLHSSQGRVCGTYGYARVFTGTVKSATDISDTDKRLELIPDEIFFGPAGEVTATVNQGCLPLDQPEIKGGDKWLVYLQSPGFPGTEQQSKQLVLPYDSPSGPLSSSSAQENISTLRHLARLTDSGIITGRVTRVEMPDQKVQSVPVSDWAVIAKRGSTGTEYHAVTDSNGHFEFELPPDSYNVTANTQRGVWAPEDDTFVNELAPCVNVDFPMHADGEIAGTVKTADGKPASKAQVALLRIAPPHQYFTVLTDERGHFEVRGQEPGQYIVGEGLIANTVTEWRLRVYYPGVTAREQAIPIDLGTGERRTDIDFKLPSAAAP